MTTSDSASDDRFRMMLTFVREPEGDISALILKFGHIFRKHLAWRVTALRKIERQTKDMSARATIIGEIRGLTIVERSIDDAIEEFRKDGENAGKLWPKKRGEKN